MAETLYYWIAGALFGGDVKALIQYDAIYMEALGQYLETGKSKNKVAYNLSA